MSETTKAPTFTSRLMLITHAMETMDIMPARVAHGSVSAISILMAAYFHPEWGRAAAELLLAESTAAEHMELGRRTADRIVGLLPIEMEMPQ